MELALLLIAISLMFSGVHGGSQSQSCSTVNGKTICNSQTSDGNAAMASSSSAVGPGGSQQDVYTGGGFIGGPWASNRQTETGGSPGGYNYPSSGFDYSGSQASAASGGFGGFPQSNSYWNSYDYFPNRQYDYPDYSNRQNFYQDYTNRQNDYPDYQNRQNNYPDYQNRQNSYPDYQKRQYDYPVYPNRQYDNPGYQAAGERFGGPPGGFSYTYASSNPNFGPYQDSIPAFGGFGFAPAGSFPFPFFPGMANPPAEFAPETSGGAAPPQPFNPFQFVFGPGGGPVPGGGAGAFAGAFAGGMPFGRR